MQGPPCASVRRFATGDGDQLRLAFAIEYRRAITAALAAAQGRLQPFLDTAFAHLFDCLAGDVKLVDDLPIMQRRTVLSLIGLQQDLCMAPTVGRRPSGLDQFCQFGPFLFAQTDHVELFHNHPSQLWPQLTGRQLIMPVYYVEQLLVAGRAQGAKESKKDYSQNRSIESAIRLGWLMQQGCELSDETKGILPNLRAADPHWCHDWDVDAAKSFDMKVSSGKFDDDPSAIINAPLDRIIPLANKLTRETHSGHTS